MFLGATCQIQGITLHLAALVVTPFSIFFNSYQLLSGRLHLTQDGLPLFTVPSRQVTIARLPPYNIAYLSSATPLGLFSNRISNLSRKLKHIMPETAKKSSTHVQNPLFPTILADRRRCPPFLHRDFQQFHTSSRPRRYCQKTQLPDPVKDFPKECLRNSHFCHLKYHITRMADHLGSYLDELVPERAKRPLLH